jgi:glycosyltransferase involved in cell wall biosynthesis
MGVIENGVDTDRFRHSERSRAEVRDKLGIDRDAIVIGMVGRLDPIKDHRTLFVAADSLLAAGVSFQLMIVGDGPERSALEQDLRNRVGVRERTTFVGATNNVLSQLSAFDVFVLPSLAEGMSNALLEAMSVGLACVASRVGGNPELIEDGSSGMLFDAADANGLMSQLQMLLANSQRRRELGAQARKRAESAFSLRRMLANYSQMYDGLMATTT